MYRLSPLADSNADFSSLERLFRAAFPKASHLCASYLRWQYEQNPDGRAVGFNAYLGDELAAHYVTLPLRASMEGRTVRGLLSLNTATHPLHQGKGLFTKLASATYELAREQGFEFVVGVANANSTPGFLKKLAFQHVAPLEARLGFGRLARRQDSDAGGFARVWSEDALRWRLANPLRTYATVRSGAFRRIEAPTGMLGIRAVLGEFPEDQGSAETAGNRNPANPLRVWLGLDPQIDWARSRYWSIPMRLRPSPLNLIFRDLSGEGRTLRPQSIRFQALDFDAY